MIMKKLMLVMMALAMVFSALCDTALAYQDYSASGYYSLWVTKPADHDHVYLYDRPSSTKGMNLGRIDNGDLVYVYYLTNGLNGNDSVWAYCDFNGVEGYIRYCNLTPENWYVDGAC